MRFTYNQTHILRFVSQSLILFVFSVQFVFALTSCTGADTGSSGIPTQSTLAEIENDHLVTVTKSSLFTSTINPLDIPEPITIITSTRSSSPTTITDSPTQEPMVTPSSANNCYKQVEGNKPVVEWHLMEENAHYLAGIQCPIIDISESPNGELLAISIQESIQNQIRQLTTMLVDMESDNHIVLNSHLVGRGHYFDWFSDTELMWVNDNGNISIGNGSDSYSIAAPKPMVEVWYISSDVGISLDSNKSLWRFSVSTNSLWEQIENFPSQNILGLGTTKDGAYSLILGENGLWKLPTNFETQIQKVNQADIPLVGLDTSQEFRVIQLDSSANWFFDIPIWNLDTQPEYPVEGFIFNLAENEFITTEDLNFPNTTRILGYDLSPNTETLAIITNDVTQGKPPTDPTKIHVINSNNLETMIIVEGIAPFNWKSGDISLFMDDEHIYYRNGDGHFEALWLTTGETYTNINIPFFIDVTTNQIIIIKPESPGLISTIDFNGTILDSLSIEATCQIQYHVTSSSGNTYFYLEDNTGQCSTIGIIKYKS